MGRSFFTGTDKQLYSGSRTFADKVSANPGAYGIDPELAAQYVVLDAEFGAAYQASRSPARTPGVTCRLRDAKVALKRMAADLAKIISGTMSVSDSERIALGLSVRQAPTPVPPPGQAHDFRVNLLGDGSLELRWKCGNPRRSYGTIYEIWRRVNGGSGFEYIGRAGGKKRFVDRTLPLGAVGVCYEIRPVRSTTAGPTAQFNVPFGTGLSAANAAAMEYKPVRAAA